MEQAITVRDYNHHTHEFWLQGDTLCWHRGARIAPGSVPSMTFRVESFRADVRLLDTYQGGSAGPVGQYGLRRSNGYLGIPRSSSLVCWFEETARIKLDQLLASKRMRKVVTV